MPMRARRATRASPERLHLQPGDMEDAPGFRVLREAVFTGSGQYIAFAGLLDLFVGFRRIYESDSRCDPRQGARICENLRVGV